MYLYVYKYYVRNSKRKESILFFKSRIILKSMVNIIVTVWVRTLDFNLILGEENKVSFRKILRF